ncbi:Predicted PurR-regulated permease PerM [Lachnospiraceae bacterium C7]|nr:Predicted PurR-regulated permease PerM [Lachnospiraceae bacterium C7]
MKFNKNWLEKKWVAYTVAICSGVVLFLTLNNLDIFGTAIATLYNFVYPVIIGMVIAYVIDPLVVLMEKNVFVKIKSKKISRSLSVIVSLVALITIVVVLMVGLIPQLINSVIVFAKQSQTYTDTFEELVSQLNKILSKFNVDMSKLSLIGSELLTKASQMISDNASDIINTSFNIGKGLANSVISFILAIYFLMDKEHMINGFKRLMRAILSPKNYSGLAAFGRRCNYILIKYIACDLVDGIIVGIVNFIFMSILGMPYALLISFIVGVTNLAPTFGPILGGAVGAFVLVLTDPIMALWFLVFTVVLQTLDGYIIKPKLFGDSLGVSSIWILIAIIVGGRMFGVTGIMLAIPVAAIFDYIYKEYFLYRLEEKKNIKHESFERYKDKELSILKDLKERKKEAKESASAEELKKMYDIAMEIAIKAHEGQKDNAGVDYINHPIKVAENCKGMKAKIVALLHDTIEDSDVTAEYLLQQGISKELVDAVVMVTKNKENYDPYVYFTKIRNNPIACEVKIADLMHNSDLTRIKNPTESQIKRTKRYKNEMAFLKGETDFLNEIQK